MAEAPIKVELPGGRLYDDECTIQTFTLNDARALFTISKTLDTEQLFKIIDGRLKTNNTRSMVHFLLAENKFLS
jgi:hypothetical protein